MTTYHYESYIERKVLTHAKSKGWVDFKWSSPTSRGVPDRILFRSGLVLMIEFKKEKQKPTIYQQHVHNQLKKQGFLVHVVDSVVSGKNLIDSFERMFT